MGKTEKIMIIIWFILVLAFSPFGKPVYAGEQIDLSEKSPGSMFLDALVYRPVGLVAIPVGAALFIISSPFSAIGGNFKSAFKGLVIKPVKFTFKRPLGDI